MAEIASQQLLAALQRHHGPLVLATAVLLLAWLLTSEC
jgi:hypothetical protein